MNWLLILKKNCLINFVQTLIEHTNSLVSKVLKFRTIFKSSKSLIKIDFENSK